MRRHGPYPIDPWKAASSPSQFTTLSQLVEHLKANFQPKCIQPGEDKEKALHYSGKHELAQQIIRMCSPEE
jgi:hypothetical protein